MLGGGKTEPWLHLCYKPADQCDSKLGVGKSELKASASERDPDALRATCILTCPAAKLSWGLTSRTWSEAASPFPLPSRSFVSMCHSKRKRERVQSA